METDPSIPGTEPASPAKRSVVMPAVPGAKKPPQASAAAVAAGAATIAPRSATRTALPEKRTVISGTALSPDLSASSPVATRSYWYWIGVTADCPSEHLDYAGIHFPKIVERVIRGPNGDTVRVPELGSLVKLNEAQVRKVADRLAHSVIRFRNEPEQRNEPGTGENSGKDPHRRGRRGYPIRIPTAAEVEAVEKAGLPSNRYDASPNDEPASRYVYCLLCPDQDNPTRGRAYDSLESTGLEWPGEL